MAFETDDLAAQAEPLRASLRELEGLADGFGRAMTTAFRQAAVDGRRLEDVLRSLALSLSGRALNAALAPIGQGIGGLIGGFLDAGGVDAGGATGLGAGAPGGSAQAPGATRRGGGTVNVTFNVTTPDAQSFRRAEAEVSAMLARAVARGQRGL